MEYCGVKIVFLEKDESRVFKESAASTPARGFLNGKLSDKRRRAGLEINLPSLNVVNPTLVSG